MNLSRFARALSCCASVLALATFSPAAPPSPSPAQLLPNPGFEQGLSGWIVSETLSPMSAVSADAAQEGKFGLQIRDTDTRNGSSVESPPIPVVPGHRYRVAFHVRSLEQSRACGVYLRFIDSAGNFIPKAPATSFPDQQTSIWDQVEFTAIAPADAMELSLWIHSYGATTGFWDLDNITLVDLNATGAALLPNPPSPATASALPVPPVPVVLKLDDLVSTRDGDVPEPWQRLATLALERKIKVSIGIIASSLEGDKPAYFDWIKKLHATGLFEFWFHGYDHKSWKEGDRNVSEFQGPPYEQQKDHFARSQALAREKLGFAFTTFGSPFNVSDASTARVLAEDTDIRVWLYGDRANPAGKTVLERVGAVSIEQPLFIPNSAKFIEGYAKYARGRSAYTIQGHPAQWDDARWAEFVRLIDFLVQNNIPLVTPLEAAARP